MTIRTAILASMVLACVGWSGAQENRLGDVAGSIKLDPAKLQKIEGPDRFAPEPGRSDAAILDEVLEGYSTGASLLADLVAQARASTRLYSSDLPDQLVEAAIDLEAEIQDLQSLRLADRWSSPLATAIDGADYCDAAAKGVRRAVANTWITFNDEVTLLAECRRLLDDAKRQAAAIEGRAGDREPGRDSAAPPQEPLEPPSADELIEALCAGRGSPGEDAYDACAAQQYRALATLEARTSATERLDEGAFEGIRTMCAGQSPGDFVARDECEQDRMLAIRQESE